MKDARNAIVFPSHGEDIHTVCPALANEAESVRAAGGTVIILDMKAMATGEVSASGILPYDMARDYDHCEITDETVEAYRQENGIESLAYDVNCFFRLDQPVTPDFYQLMRWKLGIHLVDAVLDTSDYIATLSPVPDHLKSSYLFGKGELNQRQWWLGSELIMTVPSDYSSESDAQQVSPLFEQRVTDFTRSFGRKLIVVDVVRSQNNHWFISKVLDAQSTPLPKNRDLSNFYSALTNYRR